MKGGRERERERASERARERERETTGHEPCTSHAHVQGAMGGCDEEQGDLEIELDRVGPPPG